ncbi:MAG: histidine kinase [Pseudomonadota bacterium]
MKKSTLLAILLSASTLGFAGYSLAEGPERRGAGMFERLDENKDGFLSEAELTAARRTLLEEADTNGDGMLSPEELRAHREERRAARNPDKNEDGVVSFEEFQAASEERFERLDANGDGVLDEDEKPKRRGRRGRGPR